MQQFFCKAACATVALALASGQAMAGFVYQAKTTMNSDGQGKPEVTTVQAWIEGDSARIEFQEGETMGVLKEGTYLVTRDAGETMILVNPEEKTWSEFDLGTTLQAAGAVMEQLGGMFKMEYKDFHSENVLQESGPEMLGYDTIHSIVNSGYTMSMSMMGRDMSQKVSTRKEIWATPEIDVSAFSVWMRPDKWLKGSFEGLDTLLEQEFSQLQGAPLKLVVQTTNTDNNGRNTESEMTTEVTYISEETVDEERFAIPEDYTQTSLMAEMSGDEEGGDQQFDMSKLKDLFGGKKGN